MSLNVTVSINVTDVSGILSNKLLGNGLDVVFLESKVKSRFLPSTLYMKYVFDSQVYFHQPPIVHAILLMCKTEFI